MIGPPANKTSVESNNTSNYNVNVNVSSFPITGGLNRCDFGSYDNNSVSRPPSVVSRIERAGQRTWSATNTVTFRLTRGPSEFISEFHSAIIVSHNSRNVFVEGIRGGLGLRIALIFIITSDDRGSYCQYRIHLFIIFSHSKCAISEGKIFLLFR